MLAPRHARTLSQLEARTLLAPLGRTQELDRLLNLDLEIWAEELARQGLSLNHALHLRGRSLWLDLCVTRHAFRCDLAVQLDASDGVFVLRDRLHSHPAANPRALMRLLRERLERESREPGGSRDSGDDLRSSLAA